MFEPDARSSDILPAADGTGRKPRVFIGSSSEGLKIAEVVNNIIAAVSTPVLWPRLFQADRPFIEVLEREAKTTDFAVLVATPDDPLAVRGTKHKGMRDNVLFEFGLFTGALGRASTQLVLPDLKAFRIPSDLLGIGGLVHYSTDDSLKVASEAVKTSITRQWSQRDILSAQSAARERVVRLLRFVAWVRDEIADGTRDTTSETIQVLAAKLQGVSAFFLTDVDDLGLREPFDKVMIEIEKAAHNFPSEARNVRSELETLIRGDRQVDHRAVEHLMAEIELSPRSLEEFHNGRLYHREWHGHWHDHWHFAHYDHNWRDCDICRRFYGEYGYPPAPFTLPWDGERFDFICHMLRLPHYDRHWDERGWPWHHPEVLAAISKAWWTLGAVEVAATIQSIQNQMTRWAITSGESIGEKLREFERRIHEEVFKL